MNNSGGDNVAWDWISQATHNLTSVVFVSNETKGGQMETKTSLSEILDSLAAAPTKHAARTISRTITPTYALPHHYTHFCACDRDLTEFEFRSLAALPNKWFVKPHLTASVTECVFAKNQKFFADLDGKLRTLFGETSPTRDAFVLAVLKLVR